MKKPSLSGNTASIKSFFRNHYGKMLFVFIVLIIAYALYFIYAAIYPTLISVKEIDPSEIPSVQEKIDLNRYTTTSENIEEKASRSPHSNVPNLF